jgi:hypothetical protein
LTTTGFFTPSRTSTIFVFFPLPGIDLEKCDLVVLDGDRHGGPDGRAVLRELLQAQPDYDAPATPRAFTAGRQRACLFRPERPRADQL